MPPVATDAVVLHVFDYLETSRILCLLTRDLGVVRVLARGARRSASRFGSALDLFAEGGAQVEVRPGRDLQTLTGFEVTRVHPGLAADVARFTAAAVLSEVVQRLVTDDQALPLFEVVREALRRLAEAEPTEIVPLTLGTLWQVVAEVGVAPELAQCAVCHLEVEGGAAVAFSHAAGGVLCPGCAQRSPGARRLPDSARITLQRWLAGALPAPSLSELEGRAHQRLFREFVGQHLSDMRGLRAWAAWESGRWE